MQKIEEYLADGAYASFDGQQLEIYTSNGMMKTNTVVFDETGVFALLRFIYHIREVSLEEFAKRSGIEKFLTRNFS